MFGEKCSFRNSGTPVRRTTRRKSQKMDFHELWDSCAQNKTSEFSNNGLLGIMGLLCAEQNVGNIKHALSCFFGLRLAEQNVGNLKTCYLWICSEQSTCPSSQHSTCLASQQGRCLGSQQGTCLTSRHEDMLRLACSISAHRKGSANTSEFWGLKCEVLGSKNYYWNLVARFWYMATKF